MPTAIIDVDLLHLPDQPPAVGGYDDALVIMRVNGVPIGRTRVPVESPETIVPTAVANLKKQTGWERRFVRQVLITPEAETGTQPVTVAVCTRDRPDDLLRCLTALTSRVDQQHEIIVIDNRSSADTTRNVVAMFSDRVRYIFEPRPGLNAARNRALQEASRELVLFSDDDAIPEEKWVDAMVHAFDSPSVLCVTGLTLPLELETEAQEVFERRTSFTRGFDRKMFDWTILMPVAAGRVGAGANMGVRKSILSLIGPFDEALDAGTATRSGGDTDMFARILSRGYRIVYEPAAVSWHRHRRTWQALRDVAFGYGVGGYAVLFRQLVVEHDLMALRIMWWWFVHEQIPALRDGLLKRPNCVPPDLTLLELAGCAIGPFAYLVARRRIS